MTPPKRTPQLIADLLEPELHKTRWTRRASLSFGCENEEEAELLIAELKVRGWKAKPELGIIFPREDGSEARAARLVVITGPSKKR